MFVNSYGITAEKHFVNSSSNAEVLHALAAVFAMAHGDDVDRGKRAECLQ